MQKTFKAIIFDFNGTLFFDSDKHDAAFDRFTLEQCGRHITPEEMHGFYGQTNATIIPAILKDRELTAAEIAAFGDYKEALYRELCLEDTENLHLVSGAPELLDWICEMQIPHPIASSSEFDNMAFFFKTFALDRWFDFDATVFDNHTFPGKPSPDIYRLAAEKLGVCPEACIVVEDGLSGIQSAHAAGIGHIIAIAAPERHDYFMQVPGVDAVISNYHEFDRSLLERSVKE